MSYCNPCPTFRSLPTCIETLVVGTITGHNNELIFIYLRNWTTGYVHRFNSQLSNSGVITLDVTDNGNFSPTAFQDYELYVTLQTATNTDERLTWSSNSVNYSCAKVQFEPIFTYNQYSTTYTNQTLKVVS